MPFTTNQPSRSPERLGFTAEDVRALFAAGVLDDMTQRVELFEGEIVPMQAHNPKHMRLHRWILMTLARALGDTHWVVSDATLYIEGFAQARTFTMPDIFVYPIDLDPETVRGRDVDLLIEVADTSFTKDRDLKGPLYARHGVRDYWICDVNGERTHVFRDPKDGAFQSEVVVPFREALQPLAFPSLKLRMIEAM